MEDKLVMARISELVEEEHELMQMEEAGELTDPHHDRMRELEVALDQCWDLLRQRRARRDNALDLEDAHVRSPEVVEHYLQ
jgi:Protein of unknown function (DUF2630)